MLLILKYIRLCRNLNLPAHIAIGATTFVFPVAFELWEGLNNTGLCRSCVEWGRFITYVAMWQVSTVVIALSNRIDKTRVEDEINRMSSEVEDSINQLQEDHERKITGTQDRVGDLREWVIAIRESIEEQSEMKLPAPRARIRASISICPLEATATVRLGISSGWMVRLRTWVDCQAVRFHRWFQKWVLAKDDDQS